MLSFEEVEDLKQLVRHRSAWNALCQQSSWGSPFQTYDWATTWLDARWHNKPCSVVLVSNDNRLVGCLPLAIDRHGEFWCPRSIATPLKMGMLLADDSLGIVVDMLAYLESIRPGLQLQFRDIASSSPLFSQLCSLAGNGRVHIAVMNTAASPFINLTCGVRAYLDGRSKHFRHELRRKRRRLESSGEHRQVTYTSVDDLEEAITDMLTVERNSWKHDHNSGFTSNEATGRLYTTFARRAAANGWLTLHLCYLDERPIAYLYAIIYKNACYALKTSYDAGYADLSPGFVTIANALEYAFERRLERFELLEGDSHWKSDLTADCDTRVDVCIFQEHHLRCQLCHQYEENIKPFIKEHFPMAVKLSRSLRHTAQVWHSCDF